MYTKPSHAPLNCEGFIWDMFDYIKKHKPNRVLIAYKWQNYFRNIVDDNSANYRPWSCNYADDWSKFIQMFKKKTSRVDL
jgi:hypothetical protein